MGVGLGLGGWVDVGVFVCLFCCAFIWVWSVVCSDAGLFWSVALFWCVVAIE